MKPYFLFTLLAAVLLAGCQQPEFKLPYLGEIDIVDGDTIRHQIRDFQFVNQDSQLVTNATFENKVYVVDFFFISCPTICPKVSKQMLNIHDAFADDDRVLLLAHTVDPKRDTVDALKRYADNLGVNSGKWHFVTGPQDSIYSIADDYFSIAFESEDAPGGFDHSGRIILVDQNRHVRSFCDGTDPGSVERFIGDIRKLLEELE